MKWFNALAVALVGKWLTCITLSTASSLNGTNYEISSGYTTNLAATNVGGSTIEMVPVDRTMVYLRNNYGPVFVDMDTNTVISAVRVFGAFTPSQIGGLHKVNESCVGMFWSASPWLYLTYVSVPTLGNPTSVVTQKLLTGFPEPGYPPYAAFKNKDTTYFAPYWGIYKFSGEYEAEVTMTTTVTVTSTSTISPVTDAASATSTTLMSTTAMPASSTTTTSAGSASAAAALTGSTTTGVSSTDTSTSSTSSAETTTSGTSSAETTTSGVSTSETTTSGVTSSETTTSGVSTSETTTSSISSAETTTSSISSAETTTSGVTSSETTTSSISSAETTTSSTSSAETTTSGVTSSETTTSSTSSAETTTSGVTSSETTTSGVTTTETTTSSTPSAETTTSGVSTSETTTSGVSSSETTTSAIASSETTTSGVSTIETTTSGVTSSETTTSAITSSETTTSSTSSAETTTSGPVTTATTTSDSTLTTLASTAPTNPTSTTPTPQTTLITTVRIDTTTVRQTFINATQLLALNPLVTDSQGHLFRSSCDVNPATQVAYCVFRNLNGTQHEFVRMNLNTEDVVRYLLPARNETWIKPGGPHLSVDGVNNGALFTWPKGMIAYYSDRTAQFTFHQLPADESLSTALDPRTGEFFIGYAAQATYGYITGTLFPSVFDRQGTLAAPGAKHPMDFVPVRKQHMDPVANALWVVDNAGGVGRVPVAFTDPRTYVPPRAQYRPIANRTTVAASFYPGPPVTQQLGGNAQMTFQSRGNAPIEMDITAHNAPISGGAPPAKGTGVYYRFDIKSAAADFTAELAWSVDQTTLDTHTIADPAALQWARYNPATRAWEYQPASAFNFVEQVVYVQTDRFSEWTVAIPPADETPSTTTSPGLSAGEIAGIVIGAIAGIALLVGVGTYLVLRHRRTTRGQTHVELGEEDATPRVTQVGPAARG
ncbi:hypothetical protein DFJ77DRAFT_542724 [Powellomyces hirtus]|nr:hypothetical protein DFJ77DRAFT_542724 [Powellomyces hirtus]